jgi:hypothetical protein
MKGCAECGVRFTRQEHREMFRVDPPSVVYVSYEYGKKTWVKTYFCSEDCKAKWVEYFEGKEEDAREIDFVDHFHDVLWSKSLCRFIPGHTGGEDLGGLPHLRDVLW